MHYQSLSQPNLLHLLSGAELNRKEVLEILALAASIKQNPAAFSQALQGKTLALLFEKPSFRTRLSFVLAIQQLGGMVVESVSSTRKTETPEDLIRVLNGYADFVMIRTHNHAELQTMANHATCTLINGLSALFHPCQILADLLTLQEYFNTLKGLTLAYIGDGNNILNTLLVLASEVGVKVHYCCPSNNHPPHGLPIRKAHLIQSFSTPEAAVNNADAVYTDVWTSMGFDDKSEADFAGFQVNETLMLQAKPEAVFMHCMPMERGKEVSHTLPDSPQSIIFQQSENRLHIQKALLIFLQQANR